MYLSEKLHRGSCSVFTKKLSCTLFLYNLSKDLITCWSFSYSFLYLLSLFMIILSIILLPNDRTHAIPAEIVTTIKPTPLTDNVTGIVIEPIRTTVWTDSNIEKSVLCFLVCFLIYGFYF